MGPIVQIDMLRPMKAFWTYNLARLGVFLLVYLPLLAIASLTDRLTSTNNLIVLFVALVISGVISMFALAGLRQKVVDQIQVRAERMSERIEQARSAEDID